MILQNKLQQAKDLEQIAKSIYREVLEEIMERTPNYRVYDYLAEMLENYDKVDFLGETVVRDFQKQYLSTWYWYGASGCFRWWWIFPFRIWRGWWWNNRY